MKEIELQNVCRNYRVPVKENHYLEYLFRRSYKQIEAIKSISFQIDEGETVGLVGPNGAGKSTIVKILTGVLAASSGSVRVLGRDPFRDRKENTREIGVLFGQRSQLWWDLPPEDTFQVLKRVYKIPEKVYQENLKKYSEILETVDFMMQPVRQLSLGQRMRVEILAILLHNPKILFLDEPTIGLDVAIKKQIRTLLRAINKEAGMTILLTSHDMKDIDSVCDRMIVIDHGEIVVDNTVEQVKKKYGVKETVEIEVEETHKIPEIFLFPAQVQCIREGNLIKCSYDRKELNAAAIIQTIMDNYKIVDVKVKAADIDDVVEEIYRRAEQEEAGMRFE